MTHAPQGRVLIVAGSDSGGGAGIQGDVKTVTCLGGYAATAITALTAQNTLGVQGIHPVPPEFVTAQIESVLSDIGADSIKTGMLLNAEIILAVSAALRARPEIPLVLDPVMVAKGGTPLLAPDAVSALMESLLPRAALITPNIPEAELLSGMPIRESAHMEKAGRRILGMGAAAVLVKGGHLESGAEVRNMLLAPGQEPLWFMKPRRDTRHTHGTGCTLASAIAAGIAQGAALADTLPRALDYVAAAIDAAPGLGAGHGPLGHNFMLQMKR